MSDGKAILLLILGMVVFLAVTVTGAIRVARALELPGAEARIEQLRSDIGRVSGAFGEDVLGQVTEVNQQIAANKQYRKFWWGRMVIPAGWDRIESIEIPRESQP